MSVRRAVAEMVRKTLIRNNLPYTRLRPVGGIYQYSVRMGPVVHKIKAYERIVIEISIGNYLEEHEVDIADPEYAKHMMAILSKYKFLNSAPTGGNHGKITVRRCKGVTMLFYNGALIGFISHHGDDLVVLDKCGQVVMPLAALKRIQTIRNGL